MSMTIGIVEIEPGYLVDGPDLGLVEIGPGYGVQGLAGYDDVQLVGSFGLAEKGLWSRNMLLGTAAGLLATAATAFLLGKSLAYR